MKKRGSSNIEFILAFILFVSFTAAAIYFFNPTKSTQSLEAARGYVTNILIENASVELETYSAIITAPDNEHDIKISLPGVASNKNVRVVDYYGNEIESERDLDRDRVCLTRNNQENFINIYFSEDIEGETGSCGGSTENNRIASSITSKVLSEKRILKLNESYYAEYSSIANNFNIPSGMDFSFSLEFPEGKIISAEKKVSLGREVFSDTQLKEVLREDGTLAFGYLTVKVW